MGDVLHKKDKEDGTDFDPASFDEGAGTDVVVVPPSSIAKVNEVNFTAQVKPEYVSIVHGVGKLSEMGFVQGELVLDKEVVIYSPPRQAKKSDKQEADAPAVVTILSVTEFFKEQTEYGSGDLPRTWGTEAEAKADGMITEYPPWGSGLPMPNARRAITLRLLIKEPPDVEDRSHFFFKIGEDWWAPATYIADKMSYKEVAQWLTKTMFAYKSTGITAATCGMSTRSLLIKKTGNFTKVPVFQVLGTKTPEEIRNLQTAIGEDQ